MNGTAGTRKIFKALHPILTKAAAPLANGLLRNFQVGGYFIAGMPVCGEEDNPYPQNMGT